MNATGNLPLIKETENFGYEIGEGRVRSWTQRVGVGCW